jgi:hypothetical protein
MRFDGKGNLLLVDDDSEYPSHYKVVKNEYDKYECFRAGIQFNSGMYDRKVAQYLCIQEYLQEDLRMKLHNYALEYLNG